MTSFQTLPEIPDAMIRSLDKLGYTEMTPVQSESIPAILKGSDLLAQSKTGSGKTLAFGLPSILRTDTSHQTPQTLIITPTRELAEQVAHVLKEIATSIPNLKILTLYGGVPLRAQAESLSKGAHILIGTPGRLLDHLAKETLSLEGITRVVLDEADRMLDMGFYDEITKILQKIPAKPQTLLFSATYSPKIETLADTFLKDPLIVKVETEHTAQKIIQRYYETGDKFKTLTALIGAYRPDSLLIFANTKKEVIEVADRLHREGHSVVELHGDLDQTGRNEAVIAFANGSKKILVATDVASRGLDIEGIDMVINYDLPFDQEVYTHRIGRTVRADAQGTALSLTGAHISQKTDYIRTLAQKGDPSQLRVDARFKMRSEYETLCLGGGKKEKLRKGDILGALCKEIGIDPEDIGKIDLAQRRTYIALHHLVIDKTIEAFKQGVKIKKKKVNAWVL
jgi:ATP-independent RNA helicase DbpA